MKEIDIEFEMKHILSSSYSKKTDRQLWSYQQLSDNNRALLNGLQPESLQKYNNPETRKCKLTREQADIIRQKYKPMEYGKLKLAKEFGVSKAVISRILDGKSWKTSNK